MHIKELEELVRNKARRLLGILKVEYAVVTDEKCPIDLRHGIFLGEGEKVIRIYGPTKTKVFEEALEWIDKEKKRKPFSH